MRKKFINLVNTLFGDGRREIPNQGVSLAQKVEDADEKRKPKLREFHLDYDDPITDEYKDEINNKFGAEVLK